MHGLCSIYTSVAYTLLKSDVTRRDHVVRCHGSHDCWFTHRQFHGQFHSRRHSLRRTLKSTTLVHMRSGYAWTIKSWQRSEWRLGFNSVYMLVHDCVLFISHLVWSTIILGGANIHCVKLNAFIPPPFSYSCNHQFLLVWGLQLYKLTFMQVPSCFLK